MIPNCLRKVGIRFLNEAQVSFMKEVYEGRGPLASEDVTVCLKWHLNGEALAEISKGRIYFGFEGNQREFSRSFSLEDLISWLEIEYQTDELLSVWVSDDPEDFGYDPEYVDGEEERWLVPFTKEEVERLPLEKRIGALSKVEGVVNPFSLVKVANAWREETPHEDGTSVVRPIKDVQQLFIGFCSPAWKVQLFWAAQNSEEAAKALAAVMTKPS